MAMIDDFIDRKHGRRKIEYELPELKEILEETLGVIVYQEQVMQIANTLAGYSLGEADLLRRAMGKKKAEEMAAQRERFVEGAAQRKFPPKKIEKIFDLMAQFAGYGFNKSHSAAYALLAYHTAYLKTHYPVEFMAALLTSVTGSTDDVVKYINECREMGIAVEAPDINVSDANFTPHGEAIRFGLAAVKNVGGNAIESIVAARKEAGPLQIDLRILRERRPPPAQQARAGVVDQERRNGFPRPPRAADGCARPCHGSCPESPARRGIRSARPVRSVSAGETERTMTSCPTFLTGMNRLRLASEKEILGFFISGHPLEKYKDKLRGPAGAQPSSEIGAMTKSTGKDETIATAGIIANVRVLKSKRGDFYAQATLEDMSGSIDMIVFPEAYKRLQDKVKLEVPVLVRAGVRIEEGANPKITAAEIMPLEDAKVPLPRAHPHSSPARNRRRDQRSTICTLFSRSAKARRACCLTWNAPAISWW